MAVTTIGTNSYLQTGGLVSTASGFTLFGWMRVVTPPMGADFQTALVLFSGAPNYGSPFIWFGTFLDGADLVVQLESSGSNAPELPIFPSTWVWFAATYNPSGHVLTSIVNGAVIGTAIADFSAVTFSSTFAGGDSAGSVGGLSLAYYREFQSILSFDQLAAEAAATQAVVTAVQDTPLVSTANLSSLVGGAPAGWSASGTVTASTPGPLTPGPVVPSNVLTPDQRTPWLDPSPGRSGFINRPWFALLTAIRSAVNGNSAIAAKTPRFKQVAVNLGALPVAEGTFIVPDPDARETGHVVAAIAYEPPAGKMLDEIDMDVIDVVGSCQQGTVTLLVRGTEGYLADQFLVNYVLLPS